MYRLLPVLLALAILPKSDKRLENLNSFILATKDSVTSIKSGLETFHASMMPFMMAQTDGKPRQNSSSTPGGGGQ